MASNYNNIGTGVLSALQMGKAYYNDQYAQNQQRAQLDIQKQGQDNQNAVAARVTRNDNARQLVGAIEGHLQAEGYSEWNKVPVNKLLAERPDLVMGMINDDTTSEYRKFENEKGERVGAEVVELRKNEDNTYTPMVKRGDTGEVVPMTIGRNADPQGKIQTLTQEQVDSSVNARYQEAVGNGGKENTNSYLSGANAQIAWQARQKALQLGVDQLISQGANQAQITQFGGLVDSIDLESDTAKDDLLKILKAVGGDVDAVVAAGQARADELFAEKQASEGPQTELGRTLNPTGTRAVGPNTQDRMDLNGITDPRELDMISDLQETIDASPIGKLGNKSGYLRKQSAEDYRANSDAETFYDKNKMAIGKALYRNSDLKAEFDALGPKDFATKYKDTDLNTLIPEGAAKTMSIATAPTFALTAENVKQAILDQTEKPTPEQTAQISTFLTSRGIKNQADLKKAIDAQEINAQEGQMIAWVMGATHSGSTADKAKLTQNIQNLMIRGDQDVGVAQQASLESAQAQGAAATRNAQTNYMTAMQALREYDQEAVGPMLDEGKVALDTIYKKLGLIDEDGEPTGDTFDGDENDARYIAQRITGFIPRLKQAQGPISGQAGMDFLNPMLSLYIQSQANADKASLFDSETYRDFFRKNPDGTSDFDLKNVVFGNVVDGKPTSLMYVDQRGVRSQAVPIRTIQEDSKMVAKLLVTAAESNKAFKDAQAN